MDEDEDPSEESTEEDELTEFEFLELAHKRWKQADDAEADFRKEALYDLKFSLGDQWDEDAKKLRDQDGRPCLTINRIPQFLKQVTNDQRQNRPAIKVAGVDSFSDPETAEVLQGIVRHIEVSSSADVAYDTAFDHAARMGRGFWRILTEYIPDSFDQEIVIRRIPNPFSVYFDPLCQEPDYSDAQWAFIVTDMRQDEYKRLYPKSKLSGLTEFSGIGSDAREWASEHTVRIAEYFYVKTVKRTLVKMQDGSVKFAEDLVGAPDGVPKRQVEQKKVHWCKINAVEKLESNDWAGQWIPIIPILGDEVWVDGKPHLEGMIRNARDTVRMYNFWSSSAAEMIGTAPKAPWLAEEGQVAGHEKEWSNSTSRSTLLKYKGVSIGGSLIPPPQRNNSEPPIMAITQALQQADQNYNQVFMMPNANMGVRSNETSGIAIEARQREGDTATFHFQDNLTRGMRHNGRVVIDLITKIYDMRAIARIIGDDSQEKQVNLINDPNKPAMIEGPPDAEGKIQKIFNLGVGRYDVTVTAGPSYASKRQAAVESMTKLAQAFPQTLSVALDILVKNMDLPGGDEIADRLQKMLPPQLQGEAAGGLPPEAQAQIAQASQQVQQLTAALQQLQQEKDADTAKLQQEQASEMAKLQASAQTSQMEMESNERIAAAELQGKMQMKEMEIASEERIAGMKIQATMIQPVEADGMVPA